MASIWSPQIPAAGQTPTRARSGRYRALPKAAAAASGAATPLPLLPFWQEFRSQVARLEGVEALPLPRDLAAAQSEAPPVSLRAGACHADRLRFGHFVYVNAGAMGKRRRRRRQQTGEADSRSIGSRDSSGSNSLAPLPGVSLLQGTLLPSVFSFHPPLAFQALAFNGGQSWMVAIELGTLPAAAEQDATEWNQPSSSSSSSSATAASDLPAASAPQQTPESWQAGQAARFAALRQLYSGIAAPLPAGSPLLHREAAGLEAAAAGQQQSAVDRQLLLFSSAAQRGGAILSAEDSLQQEGLAAFRQSLALHLNGLASAPADAEPQHVQRMAAAQLAWLRQRRRPLLCAAQLEAAFGRQWVLRLQEHIAASAEDGLAELVASRGGADGQQQGQQQQKVEAEWVLVNLSHLLEGLP